MIVMLSATPSLSSSIIPSLLRNAPAVVRALLAANADVNAKDARAYTALIKASSANHSEAVQAPAIAASMSNAVNSFGRIQG